MKTRILLILFTTSQLLCCTTVTTTAPDGTVTVTKSIDLPAFSKGADTIVALGARETFSGK